MTATPARHRIWAQGATDQTGHAPYLDKLLPHLSAQGIEILSYGDLSRDDRAELEQLIEQLKAALEKVPADKREEAQTVAEYTETLVEEGRYQTRPDTGGSPPL